MSQNRIASALYFSWVGGHFFLLYARPVRTPLVQPLDGDVPAKTCLTGHACELIPTACGRRHLCLALRARQGILGAIVDMDAIGRATPVAPAFSQWGIL